MGPALSMVQGTSQSQPVIFIHQEAY